MRFFVFALALPCIAAVALYTGFYAARDRVAIANIADEALGRWMVLKADTIPPAPGARPLVLLDFDDRTSRSLDDPALVPPAALGLAMKRLGQKGAKPWAIVIDLDLSYLRNEADIRSLREGLEALDAAGVETFLARPPLYGPSGTGALRYRSSPLDPFVDNQRHIMWAAVSYPTAADGVVRDGFPILSAPVHGKTLDLVSVPLGLVLLRKIGADRLKAVVAAGFARSPAVAPVAFADGVVVPRKAAVPINFTLRWPPSAGAMAQVKFLSMAPLLDTQHPINGHLFTNTIVFVGATAERRDLKATPLGEMPGVFVLINAARQWLDMGMPKPSSYWAGLLTIVAGALSVALVAAAVLRLLPAAVRRFWDSHLAGHLERHPKVAEIIKLMKVTQPENLEQKIENTIFRCLPVLFWVMFFLSGDPSLSVGLVVIVGAVVCFVELGHKRISHHRARSQSRDAS